MSATSSKNTIIESRLVMTSVIRSPESGGTLNAKILRAKKTKYKFLHYFRKLLFTKATVFDTLQV